jgi:hypothetical protein
MRRTWITLAALVFAAGSARSALAVWVDTNHCGHCRQSPCDSTVHHIKSGYYRNRDWPWPYVCADRIAVREPFCIMVDNGWRRQNLLGPHHFNPDTHQLTTAGELKVRWIMTQAPPDRRSIFVERSIEPTITVQRVETARQYAAQVALNSESPQVAETHLISEGRPASVVDQTNVRFYESLPPPVFLPATSAGAAAGQ